MRLLPYVAATSSADSSTSTTPPEFANPTPVVRVGVEGGLNWRVERELDIPRESGAKVLDLQLDEATPNLEIDDDKRAYLRFAQPPSFPYLATREHRGDYQDEQLRGKHDERSDIRPAGRCGHHRVHPRHRTPEIGHRFVMVGARVRTPGALR